MGAAKQLQLQVQFETRAQVYNHDLELFRQHSNFETLEEFNNHYEQIMVDYKKYFNKLQHEILNVVRKRAACVFGVANASYSTYIKEDFEKIYGHTVHRNTVANTIKKAEKLGIITVFDGKRMIWGRGSNTANVIVFNRVEDVKYFAIAKMQAEQAEIAFLIEEQNKQMQQQLNFARNARAEYANKVAAEQQQVEIAQQAQQAQQKRETLQQRMRDLLDAKKIAADSKQFNEYRMIMYSTIKKAMGQDPRLTLAQATELAFKAFTNMCNTSDKDIKKTRAAALTYHLKRELLAAVGAYTDNELASKRAESINGRTEQLPEWWDNHKQHYASERTEQHSKPQSVIDFAAEAKKLRDKLELLRD